MKDIGKNTDASQIDSDKLQHAAEIMRAIAHPLRLRMLEFIDCNTSIHVNAIYNSLKIEQSIASQHLRILRHAGIVHTKREGKFILYSINYELVKRINNIFIKFFDGKEEL